MLDALTGSPLFGLTQKKTKFFLCNPLLIASALLIVCLAAFDIPYERYAQGGDFIKLMLGPVTAVLALNIYNQRSILKQYFIPVWGRRIYYFCDGRIVEGSRGQD